MLKEDIKDVRVHAYTIPTDYPESDGTLEWDSTTLVLVEIDGGGKTGIGYTYANIATAHFINDILADAIRGKDALQVPASLQAVTQAVRNNGNCGIAAMAVSAIDCALWDLKARILDIPLASLLGMVHHEVMVYGSGGFTSYPVEKLQEQLASWVEQGFRHIKMKIGREPDKDVDRVKAARAVIGDHAQLFVDANGAYTVKQALEKAKRFDAAGVTWFEEPVSSEDLSGLNFIQQHAPAGINITAGEYGYSLGYFEKMLAAGAVDVLQADATRCGGISGFLKTGYLCEASHTPASFHCAPALHVSVAVTLPSFFIGEYFHDHARIENILFEGVPKPVNGFLRPDMSSPGLGLTFRFSDAEKYKVL